MKRLGFHHWIIVLFCNRSHKALPDRTSPANDVNVLPHHWTVCTGSLPVPGSLQLRSWREYGTGSEPLWWEWLLKWPNEGHSVGRQRKCSNVYYWNDAFWWIINVFCDEDALCLGRWCFKYVSKITDNILEVSRNPLNPSLLHDWVIALSLKPFGKFATFWKVCNLLESLQPFGKVIFVVKQCGEINYWIVNTYNSHGRLEPPCIKLLELVYPLAVHEPSSQVNSCDICIAGSTVYHSGEAQSVCCHWPRPSPVSGRGRTMWLLYQLGWYVAINSWIVESAVVHDHVGRTAQWVEAI